MIQLITDQAAQEQRLLITAESADYMIQFAESGNCDLDRWMDRIERYVNQQDDVAAACILADLNAIRREYALAQSGYRELVGLVVAAAEVSRQVIAQRDAALEELAARPDSGQMYDRFVELLAAHGSLSLEDAQRAAYILFSSDQDVMAYDMVDGLDALTRFREAFADIVDELKTRRVER